MRKTVLVTIAVNIILLIAGCNGSRYEKKWRMIDSMAEASPGKALAILYLAVFAMDIIRLILEKYIRMKLWEN